MIILARLPRKRFRVFIRDGPDESEARRFSCSNLARKYADELSRRTNPPATIIEEKHGEEKRE